jgi:hypothetical protein
MAKKTRRKNIGPLQQEEDNSERDYVSTSSVSSTLSKCECRKTHNDGKLKGARTKETEATKDEILKSMFIQENEMGQVPEAALNGQSAHILESLEEERLNSLQRLSGSSKANVPQPSSYKRLVPAYSEECHTDNEKTPLFKRSKCSTPAQPIPAEYNAPASGLRFYALQLASTLSFILAFAACLQVYQSFSRSTHLPVVSLDKQSGYTFTRRVRLLPYNQTSVINFKKFAKGRTEDRLQNASISMGVSGVRAVLRKKGYREVFDSDDWDLLWTVSSQYRVMDPPFLKPHQRCNNCFGPGGIAGNKLQHWRMFKRMQDMYGEDEFNFVLKSYILPKEVRALRAAIRESKETRRFIAKPIFGSRGRGIYVFDKEANVPKGQYVVQEYLDNPHLIHGRKSHLRIYLFISTLKPLRVYLHREGLALFSSEPYQSDNLHNLNSHLTNAAIGRHATQSTPTNTTASQDHSHLTWKLSYYYSYLEKELKVNVTAIKMNVAEVLAKSVMTMQAQTKFRDRTPGTCFDIYGADVMFDENFTPYVAEINLGPELYVNNHSINGRVHEEVINDVLDMTEYHPTDRHNPEFNAM